MSLLTLDAVSFSYGAAAPVLSDISLAMPAGSSALVLGDNGSGKSTLGRLIGGLARPTTGAVLIGNQPLSQVSTRLRPTRTIYVSQVSYLQFFRASIEEEIALAARQADAPVPDADTLAKFTLPTLDTNPRDLTYPEMWRLQLLLLGTVFTPSVLFIDEIVAPGLPAQRLALEHTLGHRRGQGRVTLLAYQRAINTTFDHTWVVERGRVSAG
jgi:energy-coupling factor transporter ATP-binding protein EcfA2